MSIAEIIANKQQLELELKEALSTMEKKDQIYIIKNKIKQNQKNCPHYSAEYNFVWTEDKCPYCGKFIGKGENK